MRNDNKYSKTMTLAAGILAAVFAATAVHESGVHFESAESGKTPHSRQEEQAKELRDAETAAEVTNLGLIYSGAGAGAGRYVPPKVAEHDIILVNPNGSISVQKHAARLG